MPNPTSNQNKLDPSLTHDKMAHVDSTISDRDFSDASNTVILVAVEDANGQISPFRKVGVVQSAGWGEQKEIARIYELGSEIPYQVPGRTSGSISLSRVLLNGRDLLNAFYNSSPDGQNSAEFMRSLSQAKTPVHVMFASITEKNRYSRVFSNCHIVSRSESIGAGQRIIMENASLTYSHISDASHKAV